MSAEETAELWAKGGAITGGAISGGLFLRFGLPQFLPQFKGFSVPKVGFKETGSFGTLLGATGYLLYRSFNPKPMSFEDFTTETSLAAVGTGLAFIVGTNKIIPAIATTVVVGGFAAVGAAAGGAGGYVAGYVVGSIADNLQQGGLQYAATKLPETLSETVTHTADFVSESAKQSFGKLSADATSILNQVKQTAQKFGIKHLPFEGAFAQSPAAHGVKQAPSAARMA